MRGIALILVGAALASCTTEPQPGRSARAEKEFQQLIAGKVAGAPTSCLASYRSRDMVVIDDNTLAYREGGRRVWVTNLNGGCSNISAGHYALVTRTYGGMGVCRGDIAEVADLSSGMTVGSCTFGDFVPYTKPRT